MPERLTDTRVRNAPARAKRYSIVDINTGLELRVHPDGRRIFAVRASVRANALRLTLGEYGEPYAAPDAEGGPSGQDLPLLTLVLARAEASRLKLRFKNEGDFRAKDREAEAAKHASLEAERQVRSYTIDNLDDDWLADVRKRLRASTIERCHEHRIDKYVRPRFGTLPITAPKES